MNHPALFDALRQLDCLTQKEILFTGDGFSMLTCSVSQLLERRGITEFYNAAGLLRRCDRFFDDWFVYAVEADAPVYGLLKLREQEYDGQEDAPADGDTPGVTVSFIDFDPAPLLSCLTVPDRADTGALNAEVNRVVAARGQQHHSTLKEYFLRPEAEAPYLIAEQYVRYLAGFSQDGVLAVPQHYALLVQRRGDRGRRRVPDFIDANNADAGRVVCDHRQIFLRDPANPTRHEALALLATHSGNTSFHCFAAEIRYHARFLTGWARMPIPFLGQSVYDSAIRADMTIEDKELEGPSPFHDPKSSWVLEQLRFHPDERLFL